jgi:hypothetical protein
MVFLILFGQVMVELNNDNFFLENTFLMFQLYFD